ncbi:siderophore ferric iron reductase [Paraburkholderia tagetis]|uniref:Siderophore ferric iron reductase n=1 Tax=Paraburkholderia tagetis TaxID=2913261 RepID=A0A9X1UJC6_9BURK|nr:siderophore ferric iron reductase [Paraburkholderia tagetis]MCG5076883.1 siderophore ferric iron reductase [Paraburkholderia tagetis]
MAANRTLADMLRLAAHLVPGLRGVVSAPALARPPASGQDPLHVCPAPHACESNRAALDALLAHWSRACPEAGRAYWAARCWGILIWQPVYLSVIGVHAARRALSLASFAQPIAEGWTREVRLHDHAPAVGDTGTLIALAACEIAASCAQIHDDLAAVIRVNPVTARGTQADVVLAALLAASKARPEWRHADIEATGRQWLAALDIDGCGGYFAFERSDGSRALALERRTCCYHYRRRDGEMCSTCPRLAKQERVVRLNAQRDATLEA